MKCSPPQCIASTPPHDMTTDQNQDILWLSFISSWRKCAQTHQTHVVTYCTVHVMYRLCKLHKEYSSSMNVSWAFSQHSLHCFCNTAKAYVLFCFVETWRTGMSFRVNSHFSLFHDWIHFILRYKIHQQLFYWLQTQKTEIHTRCIITSCDITIFLTWDIGGRFDFDASLHFPDSTVNVLRPGEMVLQTAK